MACKPTVALSFLLFCIPSRAQQNVPPYDLWTAEVLAQIRDPRTLDYRLSVHGLYTDVFYTSNPSAGFFDAKAPYAEHTGEKITIHGFLAAPLLGGPYPALVIGHGHGGKADASVAELLAALGYVALYIDGPRAGQSTGGPEDDNQAWISVDKGPQYGYLYHYGYAGMRALTLLEELARLPGNPYRIDPDRLGAIGASMGGIFATYLNGIDSRMKAAVIMASAGSWAHTLRYPNSWLYHGIYAGTRDIPYNGSDPINSIEDIDRDPTAITFMNYFDPIRYAPRQYAPVLTLIGTHDQYFPLPSANLMLQAINSAGTAPNFEKRLWIIPNAPHGFDQAADLISLAASLRQFFDFAFGGRARPLATPRISMSEAGGGLRFEISLAETPDRLAGANATLYAATRVDSTGAVISDFVSFPAILQGDRFVAQIPAGARSGSGDAFTAENAIYYVTVVDPGLLQVSSMVYKGALPMDLSTDFTPVINHAPGDNVAVPLPPPLPDAAETVSSSLPVLTEHGYQGLALSNPTLTAKAVRVEARTPSGRIAAGEGLINPIYISLPERTQTVFVHDEWFGPGAHQFDGSMHAFWTDAPPASLSFRGSEGPGELDSIGPASAAGTELWLPLAPEQAGTRKIRIFGGSANADVAVIFRGRFGDSPRLQSAQVKIPARGTADVTPPSGTGALAPASAEIQASSAVSARLEVSGAGDPWSLDARPVPASTRYFQPHTEWNGVYTTRLVFLNPSDSIRRVNPHLRRHDGSEIGVPSFFIMNPRTVASYVVEDLFQTGTAAGSGWVDLEAPDGPVVAVALAVDRRTGAAAASAIDAGGSGTFSMPFYVESTGYWTGLAIANVGSMQSDILITAFDRSGQQIGQWSQKLNPQEQETKLVYQWMQGLAPGTTGQITITTSGSVALLAYFGTSDGAALAAIPFASITR